MVLDELPCPSCGVDHRWWSSSLAIAQTPIKSAKFSLSICFLIPSLKKKDRIRSRVEKSSSQNPLAPSPNPWIFLKLKGQKKSFFATPTCSSHKQRGTSWHGDDMSSPSAAMLKTLEIRNCQHVAHDDKATLSHCQTCNESEEHARAHKLNSWP